MFSALFDGVIIASIPLPSDTGEQQYEDWSLRASKKAGAEVVSRTFSIFNAESEVGIKNLLPNLLPMH